MRGSVDDAVELHCARSIGAGAPSDTLSGASLFVCDPVETASMRSPCARNKPYTLNKHYTLTCVQVRGVWSTVYALIGNYRIRFPVQQEASLLIALGNSCSFTTIKIKGLR